MASPQPTPELKNSVRDFWNSEPCGTRYLNEHDDFAAQARQRYEMEPHIFDFAGFAGARGLRVLEIGVGMGADYLEWLKAGARASGVDLSAISIARARRRCEIAGYETDLRISDAESLPFPADSFDIVYSYGVMHHSPDTRRCVQEGWRVLKPGGELKIMVYHHRSLTGLMLWLRYGIFRGKTQRQTVYEHLESPGTKAFTRAEVQEMFTEFRDVRMRQVFSPGDLLMHEPSARFRRLPYRILWKIFPRALVRPCCERYGLFLLISARKPAAAV